MKSEFLKIKKLITKLSDTKLRKNTMTAAMLFIMAVFSGGCSLAQDNFSLAREEQSLSQDRLAGIFVTENYIEPGAPELEYNLRGEITIKEQEPQKIYGQFDSSDGTGQLPVFPGLEGYGIYILELAEDESNMPTVYSTCDNGFADLHITASDEEESMEASLYYTADSSMHYYFNPVYQQEDGQIYLLPGSGIFSDSMSEGAKSTQSLSQSVSRTENGTETSKSYRFTVNLIAAVSPADTEVFFMDRDNQVLQRLSEAELNALYETQPQLVLPEDTAYLILRQTGTSQGQDSRSLFDYGCEYLEYMVPAEHGLLRFLQLPLVWP